MHAIKNQLAGFSLVKKAVVIKPISKDDLDWLLGHTKRDEKQIVEMHRKFHTDYPSGNILRQYDISVSS